MALDKVIVDWNKVAVNTPILVKDHKDEKWIKRYFAEYSNGRVYAWADGLASWTADGYMLDWNYAKLARQTSKKRR